MNPRILNLTSTTFGGERLSRRALAGIQETVQFFPQFSRTELARTVCEQVALWNQWVEHYHPPGYRQTIATHLRYWVRDGRGRLPFDFATRRLRCRDRSIGWEG